MNRYEPIMRKLKAMPISTDGKPEPIRVSEEEIRDAERLLGVTLPANYREFLYDFGAFHLGAFCPLQRGEILYSIAVNRFLGVMSDPGLKIFDIVTKYEDLRIDWEDWIVEWMPIADNLGDYIAMDIKGQTQGAIYLFPEDGYDEDDKPSTYLLANSFDEFMQLLTFGGNEEEAEELFAPFWANYHT